MNHCFQCDKPMVRPENPKLFGDFICEVCKLKKILNCAYFAKPTNSTSNMRNSEPKYFIKINDKFYPILEWDIRVDYPKIPIGCVTFAFNPPCGRETISYNLAKSLGIYEEKTEKVLVKDLV